MNLEIRIFMSEARTSAAVLTCGKKIAVSESEDF